MLMCGLHGLCGGVDGSALLGYSSCVMNASIVGSCTVIAYIHSLSISESPPPPPYFQSWVSCCRWMQWHAQMLRMSWQSFVVVMDLVFVLLFWTVWIFCLDFPRDVCPWMGFSSGVIPLGDTAIPSLLSFWPQPYISFSVYAFVWRCVWC